MVPASFRAHPPRLVVAPRVDVAGDAPRKVSESFSLPAVRVFGAITNSPAGFRAGLASASPSFGPIDGHRSPLHLQDPHNSLAIRRKCLPYTAKVTATPIALGLRIITCAKKNQ
jgi:hypothetical protein